MIGMSPYSFFIHATVLLIAQAVIDSQLEPDLVKLFRNYPVIPVLMQKALTGTRQHHHTHQFPYRHSN